MPSGCLMTRPTLKHALNKMLLEITNSHLVTLSDIIRCASSDRELITQSLSAASWSELAAAFGMSVREDEVGALCLTEVGVLFDQVSARFLKNVFS